MTQVIWPTTKAPKRYLVEWQGYTGHWWTSRSFTHAWAAIVYAVLANIDGTTHRVVDTQAEEEA